jgi:hypothetical protein
MNAFVPKHALIGVTIAQITEAAANFAGSKTFAAPWIWPCAFR